MGISVYPIPAQLFFTTHSFGHAVVRKCPARAGLLQSYLCGLRSAII